MASGLPMVEEAPLKLVPPSHLRIAIQVAHDDYAAMPLVVLQAKLTKLRGKAVTADGAREFLSHLQAAAKVIDAYSLAVASLKAEGEAK
jgi:hypothetical protein